MYYAFQMLYWTGIREGELLALTPADFDFERGTVKISKTYQRLKGKDCLSNRYSGTLPTKYPDHFYMQASFVALLVFFKKSQ